MICPGCEASLKRADRVGGTCVHCGRRFALDPWTDGPGMHDVRIRRCVERATDDGRLRITLTQLWYASRAANPFTEAAPSRGVRAWKRWTAALPLSAALVAAALSADGAPGVVAAVLAPVVLILAAALRHRPARRASARVQPARDTFAGLMRGAWTTVYGGLPRGVVDEARKAGRKPAGRSPAAAGTGPPRVAIVCDPVIARFLTENRIPDLPHTLLVTGTGARKGGSGGLAKVREALDLLAGHAEGLPVVVLHDADAEGALLAPALRAALPGRTVVDAGLRPGAAARNRRAVRLLSSRPGYDAEVLRTVGGLPDPEAALLAEGWWWPLAAVPPPLLAMAVAGAVEHAVASPTPVAAGGATLAQGFLTWPDPTGRTPQKHDRHDRSTS